MDESSESHGIVAAMASASTGSGGRGVVSSVSSVTSGGVMTHSPSPSVGSTTSQSPHKNKDPALSSVSTISPAVPIDHSCSPSGPPPPPPAATVTSLPLQTMFSEAKKISVEELFKMSQQAAAAVSDFLFSSI